MARIIKSDNPEHIGKHAFEVAGLGEAPFRFVGVDQKSDGCQFCGTGIMYRFFVRDKNGREFYVGSDCINRTGDHGLIQGYKSHPEYRKMLRDKARAKDNAVIAAWNTLISDPANVNALTAVRVPDPRYWIQRAPDNMQPWLDAAKFAWGRCGAAGRARYLKAAKKIIIDWSALTNSPIML